MRAASERDDKQQPTHALTVAAIALVLGACGGGGGETGADAQHACAGDHDEDGDGLADNCDNCPTAANPTQADTTEVAVHAFEDGIGDACDYRPGLSGDEIGALFTFADPAQANAWNGSGWTIANDAASASGVASWTSRNGEMGDGLIVVARVESVDLASGDLRLAVDGDGASSGDTCTLHGDQLVAEEIGAVPSMKTIGVDITKPFSLVAWRRVLPTGPTFACRVEQDALKTEVIVDLTDALTVGAYALVSTGATATLSSVIVYTSPGPKNP